jgi:hypothetical protein
MTKPIMPAFIFGRRRDVELEAGFILAGQLIVDIPKGKKLNQREQQMITEIVQRLTAQAQSRQMPDDAIVCGWPGGSRPANAADVHDNALVESWAKDRVVIALRVDPREGGRVRIDSDIARQAGFVKRH